MATTAVIDLKNFVPPIIKNQALWEDFLDAVSDELDNMRVQIELKKRVLNIELYTDIEELVELGRSLGYSANLTLTDDYTEEDKLLFVQQEVASIVFKIKSKATYAYYDYLFKLIPKLGTIFILYKDYLHLARAINYTTTFTNLSTHNWSLPFVGVESILHYDEYNKDSVSLDSTPSFDLDSDIIWYLDQDIITKPTQHLALEYRINELYTNEELEKVLITDKYLKYLSIGVHYGRKVTNTPHVGFSISFMLNKNGFFDHYSGDANYSIPLLETKCAVTDGFRSIDNIGTVIIKNTLEESFKYLAIGTGKKEFTPTAQLAILSDLVHFSFEDINTNIFKDNISTLYTAIATGDYELQNSISGKAIYYNGIDSLLTVANYASIQQDTEINFWIQAGIQLDTNPRFLYQSGFLDVFYNTANESIDVTLTGSVTTSTIQATGVTSALLASTDYNISIVINDTSSELKLYLNDSLISTNAISGIGTFNSISDLLIGSDTTNYFLGKIDELRLYSKILANVDRTYLYTSKLGTLNYLSNEVYRQEISTNQIKENDYWLGAGIYPYNSLSDEIIAIGDDSFSSLSGILNYANVAEGMLTINYFSLPDYYTITSDKKGNLIGDASTGTINYITGEYSITFFKDFFIFKEGVSPGGVGTISYTADHTNLKTSSIGINYTISGTRYEMILDNGSGEFVNTGIASSSINYALGLIDITFTDVTEVEEIYITYYFTKYSKPTSNINVVADYKIKSGLEITEAGLLNEDGIVTAYATFPKAEVEGVFNHMSTQFFVEV